MVTFVMDYCIARRAYPSLHISCVVLLLIAPWFIYLFRRIDARGLNVLGAVGFVVLFLGLISTVSRVRFCVSELPEPLR